MTAGLDPLRDEGLRLGEALTAAGVEVLHVDALGMPHGVWDFMGRSTSARTHVDDVVSAFSSLVRALQNANDGLPYMARYVHPISVPMIARAGVPADRAQQMTAATLGCSGDDLLATRIGLQVGLERAAREASTRAIEDWVADLPFISGDRIVALGDSITDDLCSWAEMLGYALQVAGAEVDVINAGVSGHTTADAVARIDLIAAAEPTWVIQLLGTNDVRRHGRVLEHRMVELDETRRHLVALGEVIQGEFGARLLRMTPPSISDGAVNQWAPFHEERITWRSADLAGLAELLVDEFGALDIYSPTSELDPTEFLVADGVHPSVGGQAVILHLLVEALCQLS